MANRLNSLFMGAMKNIPTTGQTGHECKQSGDYKCSIHPSQIIPIAKPNIFPPCNTHGNTPHAAKWILVKAR